MKIYTKTGDKGTTRLVDGSCVEKFNPRVEAYGNIDELNSCLGLVRSLLAQLDSHSQLQEIAHPLEWLQNILFSVGSLLATAEEKTFQSLPQITDAQITQLEKWIDQYNEPLPPLKNFILPSGHIIASHLHICRTTCRKAERRSSEIFVKENQYQNVLIFLNRLSDLLFVWARWINFKTQTTETIWKQS